MLDAFFSRPALVVIGARTMLGLNSEQRGLMAEKACDIGNVAAGALVFGQVLGDRFYSLLALCGIVVWSILWAGAMILLKDVKERQP
jgi:hypothetical protein